MGNSFGKRTILRDKITKVTTSADKETNLIKDGVTSVEVSKETVLEVTVEAGEGATALSGMFGNTVWRSATSSERGCRYVCTCYV